jgi:serine/threonine protein kinase
VPKAAGDRIGRYVIDRQLGAGGMAEAYLAHQEGIAGFKKPVVVKLLHQWMAQDEKNVALFLREARVGAELGHSNIVQIFDVGEEKNDPARGRDYFIAMEYIDGLTLQQAARRSWALGEGIPVDVVVRIVADAARGLDYAHQHGVIHRDMSPDNIIIANDGAVKVLDFGIAKTVGSDATKASEAKGKIPFMAPEQLLAEPVDARTDLWAIGITLYWCLAGKRPFAGDNDLGTMRAIVEEPAPPLRARNPAVSRELEAVVMRLLAKKKADRFATAAELADELSELLPPTKTNPVVAFVLHMRTHDAEAPERIAREPRRTNDDATVALKNMTGGFPAVHVPSDEIADDASGETWNNDDGTRPEHALSAMSSDSSTPRLPDLSSSPNTDSGVFAVDDRTDASQVHDRSDTVRTVRSGPSEESTNALNELDATEADGVIPTRRNRNAIIATSVVVVLFAAVALLIALWPKK